ASGPGPADPAQAGSAQSDRAAPSEIGEPPSPAATHHQVSVDAKADGLRPAPGSDAHATQSTPART
ncbi:MAG TPA: hypothetical protein VH573_02060, partial [Mycobacteriales bacterium]